LTNLRHYKKARRRRKISREREAKNETAENDKISNKTSRKDKKLTILRINFSHNRIKGHCRPEETISSCIILTLSLKKRK
jgi:hypothetical protein